MTRARLSVWEVLSDVLKYVRGGMLLSVGRYVLLVCILLTAAASPGQDDQRPIGSIDFFGYTGLDLDRVRSALPIHVGDTLPGPVKTIEGVRTAVTAMLGRGPTDVNPVCCDNQGNFIIFVGLPGPSIVPTKFNPVPKGNTHFPSVIATLYQ